MTPEEKNENCEMSMKYWGLLYETIDNFHKYGGLRIVILYELKDGPLNGKEISDQIELHQKKLHEILLLLPTIKLYVAPAMALAQQHKNKIKRYFHFVSNIIVLSVFINKDDEQV